MTGGINLKTIFGQMETYNATASACDIGLNYVNDSSRIVISLIVKNLGFVFSQYSISEGEMPFDIQLGISKKLKHLPFRFSIIGHQLHKANIRYDDPNLPGEVDAFGNPTQSSGFNQAIDNVFRHMIFSGEFLLGRHENLRLRIGYNHLRRKKLSVSSFKSLAGLSTRFGIKIKQFRLDYGIGYYHLAGATNHITISTNFKSFRKDI